MSKGQWKTPKMFRDEPASVRFETALRVSDLKNLGPSTEKAFAEIGIKTAKQFKKLGWQKTMTLLIKRNPKNNHSLYAYALIGALENIEWNRISDKQKKAAQEFCGKLRDKSKNKTKVTSRNR